MAESESNPGESLDLVEELQSEVNRGLLALAEYLHKAWGLPGSVEDLRKEVGPENCPQERIEGSGVEKVFELEEDTNET